MGIVAKVESVERDIALIFAEELSPKARSKTLAQFAADALRETDEINRNVLGRIPRRHTFVDGREGDALDTVKPDGLIVAEYELITDVLVWIGGQLTSHPPSPLRSGRYIRGQTLFADGTEIPIGDEIPDAQEYVFINVEPYARKIERGESPQAPEGVFEVTALRAQARFGNVARIRFEYRTAIGGVIIGGRLGNSSELRNPAIVVTGR